MEVKNKSVVITGGSSGLGLALAKNFAKQGAKIALIARNEQKLVNAKAEILKFASAANNESVLIYSVDLSKDETIQKVVDEIANKFSTIDILVNSAGILSEGYFENTSMETFRAVNETNYLALVNMTKICLPYLKQSKGHIVNIASMASFFGAFGYTAYCASKFAVLGFSEALRYELKPQGIKVHVVCPPEFEGPMVEGISDGRTPENKTLVRSAGVLSVDQVLKATLKGLKKDRFIIPVGSSASAGAFLNRLFPGLVRWALDQMVARIYRGPGKV